MKKTVLIAGFACFSLIATAQSNQNNGQATSARDAKPRDIATGQASGKRQHQPMTIRKATDDSSVSAREVQSGLATGRIAPTNQGVDARISSSQPTITENKKTMSPNGQTDASASASQGAAVRESPTLPGKGKTQITAADLDADGKADVSVQHDVKSPRDNSTGVPTGKRQHSPMPVTKEVETSSPTK